ncbi:Rieske (2Fe-2S) protein [Tundrisphaera lichenicola]|uniref:Rieske (2Fe-2S) protein n=1 Tax=Tundrisphaera lichenicola TaxID=2029860 RepID=UPI003EBEED24
MSQFVEACGVEDIREGRALAVEVDGLRIAIYRHEGNYHALLGRCPHANGAMGHGWVEEGEAVCPLHRWRFKLSSGRCSTMPGQSLHRFRCEVRDGRVWVEA